MRKLGSTSICAILLILSPSVSQAADVLDQLRECARTEDDTTRIACYEQLGKQALQIEAQAGSSAPPSSAPTASTTTESAGAGSGNSNSSTDTLPESIGGGKFDSETKSNAESWNAVLKACQRSGDGKWFVKFENGQVWKQVGSRTIRKIKCSGSVAINKDAFGYKMQLPDGKGKIRIRRQS